MPLVLYVLDTFAWIEYFKGSESGRKARDYVEGKETTTPSVVIAEFTDKYVREKMNPSENLTFIKNRSIIADLDYLVAELAGRLTAQRKAKVKGWGLVDSIVLSTARARKTQVVTGDEHFRDLDEEVIMIV